MKIDHMQNPLGIVKRFNISYDRGKRELEGRIYARMEEGLEEVNWFDGEVRYPGKCEIGGMQLDKFYQDLKHGAPTRKEAERKMRRWLKSFGLNSYTEVFETAGVVD